MQKQQGYTLNKENGVFMGQRVIPLESIGVYVQEEQLLIHHLYLMNVIPAKVAGVKEITMITPPNKEGEVNPYIGVQLKLRS